jgi:hypothetical protein
MRMNDPDFPSDAFLLKAIEAYFLDAGFDCERPNELDCEAISKEGGVRWLVEVVGGSTVDKRTFQQKLGRLITHMDAGPKANYVLAVPRNQDFVDECKRIPSRVRRGLNIWWCIVSDDSVLPVKPDKELELRTSPGMESD